VYKILAGNLKEGDHSQDLDADKVEVGHHDVKAYWGVMYSSTLNLGPMKPAIEGLPRTPSQGVKLPGSETDHSV
jgi:hypothetical protein